jgi:hypothetical protein
MIGIARLAVPAFRALLWARVAAVLAALAMCGGGLVLAAESASAASCHYHRSGSHWVCITPGAFCPGAAHRHYGLDKYNLKRKYWCEYNHGWRWEPKK